MVPLVFGENNMTNKPTHEIRLGSVRAAIWQNILANGITHSATLFADATRKMASGFSGFLPSR